MIDPILAEAVRAHALRTDVFRRLQRHLRDVVDPQLEERLRLLEENAALKDKLDALKEARGVMVQVGHAVTGIDTRRGPGRPRKVVEPVAV